MSYELFVGFCPVLSGVYKNKEGRITLPHVRGDVKLSLGEAVPRPRGPHCTINFSGDKMSKTKSKMSYELFYYYYRNYCLSQKLKFRGFMDVYGGGG